VRTALDGSIKIVAQDHWMDREISRVTVFGGTGFVGSRVARHLRGSGAGGTRGGGKTDGVLGKWSLKEKQFGSAFNAIMFRKTTVSAEDAIERSREIYEPLGAHFNNSRLRWRMPNGGRVSFAYLETVKDADQYQGRNVTDIWVEEAGLYESPDPIDRLFGVLRSAHDVPTQIILTGNPGGAGQHWIRHRYHLYPFPRYPRFLKRKQPPLHQSSGFFTTGRLPCLTSMSFRASTPSACKVISRSTASGPAVRPH
jgi:hypothetical protein